MNRPAPEILVGLADRYREGETFEDLALDVGCSHTALRGWLVDGGYVISRPKGQRDGTTQKNVAHARPGQSKASVKSVKSRAAWRGHRRRGLQR